MSLDGTVGEMVELVTDDNTPTGTLVARSRAHAEVCRGAECLWCPSCIPWRAVTAAFTSLKEFPPRSFLFHLRNAGSPPPYRLRHHAKRQGRVAFAAQTRRQSHRGRLLGGPAPPLSVPPASRKPGLLFHIPPSIARHRRNRPETTDSRPLRRPFCTALAGPERR